MIISSLYKLLSVDTCIPRAQFWIELFGDLRDAGYFNGSHEHQCLLRFSFMGVLQKDLDECVDLWNKHRIRASRLASCPGGIPDELFLLPHRCVIYFNILPCDLCTHGINCIS